MDSKTVSSSAASVAEAEEGGRVVRDMRYWKPWQPPDSTDMRRARSGFASRDMISRRRAAARGVMSMVMSLPEESFRAFAVMVVAKGVGDAENDRSGALLCASCRGFKNDLWGEVVAFGGDAAGDARAREGRGVQEEEYSR